MAEWDVIRREPAPAQAPQQNAADDGWAVVQRAPARGPDFSDPASVSASLIGSQPYDTPDRVPRAQPGYFSNLMDVGARGLVGLGSTVADAIRLPATANEAATRALGMEPAESGTIASAMRGSLRSIADAVDPQWLIDDLDKAGVGAGTRDLGDFTDAIDPWSGQRMGARAETIARIVPEVLAGSVGEMASSVNPLSMTAMILGKAEDNAQERAENDKREDPTLTDVGLGGAAGAIEMLLERFTTMRYPQLLRGPGNAAPGVLPAVGRVARETGIQSGLGGLEELAPYLATTVGTEKGANAREAVGTFGLGALAEGVLGGAMSAGGEIANPVAAPAPAERIEPSWRIDPETGALDIDIVGGTPETAAAVAQDTAAGVQSAPQQSAASAMMGENDVQGQEAEGQAGREAGARRQAEEGVQEEVTPAAAMAAGVDLSPRLPAAATLTGGETREQILEEIAGARTADERARHAGRLAEYDARVRGAEAGPVEAVGQAGAGAAQEGLPEADRPAAGAAPQIPDFAGLTPAQREIETRARERVTRDPEAALRDYAALPNTDGGRVVNTDEAREIFEDYNSGPDARSANAVAVHEPASWVANETFRRRMAAPVAEGKDAAVFFTGGGTGAGKSTGPKRIAEIGDAERNADTVFDGNLSGERSAVSKIELALNSGREVNILYTFRDPVQAFLHGALPRAERADYGRTVPTKPHTDAHVGAAQTYFALRERYANDPRVRIRALWNDFEPGVTSEIRQASDEEIRAIADADRGTLQQELNDALEQARQAGKVSDRVYYGTRGEPAPQRQERGVDSPGELAGQPAAEAGEQAPRLTPASPGGDVQDAVRRVLPANANVSVVAAADGVPAEVMRRVGMDANDTTIEGFYDPVTETAYVIQANLATREGMPVAARAAWVAAHEWVGHHGLRTLSGDQLQTVLRRAGNNSTVAAVVRALASEPGRPERGSRLVEEAIVELAAAVRTGNYGEIEVRYGVKFTPDTRGDLRAMFERLLNALRRALGWDGFSDAELYDLIADSAAAAAGGPETTFVGDLGPVASRVGTRNPTAVKATESGADPRTVVGYDSFRADPKAFEKNTQLLTAYPGIRPVRGKQSPEKIAEAFISHSVDNLLELHDAMPAELRARAKQWYVGANRAANYLADRYGITDVQAAASIAAMSPQKDWFQNLSLAERVIDAHVNQNGRAWDSRMSETLNAIFGKEQYADLRAAIEGKPLSALTDPVERAAWIRTYDQTYNDSAFPITSPEGNFESTSMTGAGNPARIQWGSLGEAAKAISVLQNGALENVSGVLGRMHKIRSFYNNIIDPNNAAGDVTIDTHAVAAALIRPLSAAAIEVGHNFGAGTANSSVTGNSGMYGLYAEAYRRAAAERGMLPREMQSITWEAVRTLYPASTRRPNSRVLREVNDIWSRYGKREINHDEAVEGAIDAGGGITAPDWARSDARVDAGEWAGAFRPAVAGAAVPGGGARPAAARAGDPAGAGRGIHPDAAVTLNIGLSTAELRGGGELTRAEVLRAIRATGARVLNDSRQVSDSEPTLVVDLDRALTPAEGDQLSAALDQEAIVQRNVDGSGELFGPMAGEWGPYNPELFVLHDGGRGDGPIASRAPGFSAKPRQPDAVSVDGYHYSNTPGLTELDPSFAGTAGAGRERRRFGMGQFGQRGGTAARLGFYVREPGAPVPAAEDVVAGAGGRSLYRVQLDNLYDLRTDPRGFAEEAGMNQDMLEEEIADAGFDGFVAGAQPGIDTPVAVVFDIGRKKIPVESVAEGPIASRAPQTDTPAFRRWFGDSKVVDANGEPLVVYHGSGYSFDEFVGDHAGAGWFARNPSDADRYSTDRDQGEPQTYAAYLSIKNPLILGFDMNDSIDAAAEVIEELGLSVNGDFGWANRAWEAVNTEEFADFAADAGYDGIRVNEGGNETWNAFFPEQIKSATGNSGAFDPENPSIIASRATPADAHRKRGQLFGRLAAAGYRQGSVTQPQNRTGGRFVGLKNARDGAIVALQDKMLPLRRAQQRVSADGAAVSSITLDDAMNAYRLENLMHGAVNDELKRIEQTHVKAIQDGIRKSPFTVEQFEDYLYAKAAPERNREIAKINQGMPDAGSGITTKMAGDIIAGRADGVFSGERLTPEAIKLFDQLNKHARALRDLALDNMVSAGQITPKLAADLKAKYPNYVPMRGKDAELDEGRGGGSSGRGISQRAADIRRALGRGADNIPVNILGELVGDAQRSVVAKAKAKVARSFLRFALANPQPDLYTVEPVDMEWKFSEATGEAYLGVKRRGEDINETMLVMHEGNPVYIRITDPDLRDAVLNMGVEDMGRGLRIFSALNRWRSAVLTRFNPAFTPVNMVRDLHFGTTAITAEHGAGVAARTIAAYPSAMRAAYRHEAGRRGDASKPVAQRTMADWAAEAYANGMSTGVTHVPNVVDLQRDLVESTVGVMKLAFSGRPLASIKQAWLRTAGPLIEAIENANGASENAIRLAVYTTLRKDGWSIDRAAEYAKNVTINFNRKGQAGSVMNAIFLFFNAAVQGTVAVTRVLRRPGVAAYLGGLATLQGVIAAGLMDDEDDDGITPWDKIPDYVKRTSLIIPLGDDDYFALPMPYGFNWFTYLGGRGTQRMLLGDRPTDKSVFVDLAKSLSEAFVPIPLQDGYRSLFGDQVGFAMGLASNTDDFGSPIAKSDAYSDYPAPRALEGKVTTPQVYHWAAQLLAKVGGADLEERKAPVGWLDVAPEHIEALVDYLGGGITSLANKGMRMGEQMGAGNIEGAMGYVTAAPIASRLFVQGKDARAIADRYYGERGEFARHRDIVNARLEKGMSLEEAIKDRPQEYVAGMNQATYKRAGRTKDGKRYRRGQPRVDAAGKPVIEQDRATPPGVLKDVEKRNKAIGKAITEIRGGKLTNEEIAALYDTHYRTYMATVGDAGQVKGATGKATDIGLPEGFDEKAKAPARVRNRTIKLLQDIRAEEQRRLLRALDFERGTGQGGDVEENIFG